MDYLLRYKQILALKTDMRRIIELSKLALEIASDPHISPEEHATLQGMIEQVHRRLLEDVEKSRRLRDNPARINLQKISEVRGN